MNKKENTKSYRLPTEAEWEYAARAGSSAAYSFGNNMDQLDNYAWFHSNSRKTMHPVAQKKADRWGLYDMHGNFYEWCQDWFGNYPPGLVIDPKGPSSGKIRVFRGGNCLDTPVFGRSARRLRAALDRSGRLTGFRLVLVTGQ